MDNGPEFIARITSNWSFMHNIEFKYIEPGKPTQNAFVERFNGSYRRGVLNKYIFENLEQVREQTQSNVKTHLQRDRDLVHSHHNYFPQYKYSMFLT